jgi:hypothetical protein
MAIMAARGSRPAKFHGWATLDSAPESLAFTGGFADM